MATAKKPTPASTSIGNTCFDPSQYLKINGPKATKKITPKLVAAKLIHSTFRVMRRTQA